MYFVLLGTIRHSQPKSVGLVWGSAANWHFPHHQMNRVKLTQWLCHDDSSTNISVVMWSLPVMTQGRDWAPVWAFSRLASYVSLSSCGSSLTAFWSIDTASTQSFTSSWSLGCNRPTPCHTAIVNYHCFKFNEYGETRYKLSEMLTFLVKVIIIIIHTYIQVKFANASLTNKVEQCTTIKHREKARTIE